MQAQQIRTVIKPISQAQSLAAVETLLKAGLGAITFLRSLLPEENFIRCNLTTVDNTSAKSSELQLSQSSSQAEETHGRQVSGFKIMTMTRGYTDEADKILNYLEYGIFDALAKQYLKSFIFAIYLDSKDPNNIVEAYTFNFKYHTLLGSNISVPVMTLGGTMPKAKGDDPVTKAIESGKAPTLKDVKQSVKTLLKTLIHAMNHMDVLPRRRYATFKVFYTDMTPFDYEPPYFQAGDVERDRWFFMTHDLDEIPDRNNVGNLDTGHHFVNLSMTSIAAYLPTSTENDNAAFMGTTTLSVPTGPALTPVQEANLCKEQVERQIEDAEQRSVVWSTEDDVELSDEDAEGEDDPDYSRRADGRYERVEISLVGHRGNDGNIEPLSDAIPDYHEGETAHFNGVAEVVANRLDQLTTGLHAAVDFEETQPLSRTPPREKIEKRPEFIDSPSGSSTLPPTSSLPASPEPEFDHEMLKKMSIAAVEALDIEMLDLETQRVENQHDSIHSFATPVPDDPIRVAHDSAADNGLHCECDIETEDAACFCEGGCGNWFHVWCMGYHSAEDRRMPPRFVCFSCRVQNDLTWELIKYDIYPKMLDNFRDLALFRRSIKVAEKARRFNLAEFTKALGSNNARSRLMIQRLEDEDFISEETSIEEAGLPAGRARNIKAKTNPKLRKTRKNIQRIKYIFNRAIKSKSRYADYFTQDAESRLIGLLEMTKNIIARPSEETQTQEETQEDTTREINPVGTKRPGETELVNSSTLGRPKKRVKISLAVGIDLAE